LKILHLNDHYDRVGGAETILLQLLDALEKEGVTNVIVHAYPTKYQGTRRTLYQVPGLESLSPKEKSGMLTRLKEIVRVEHPDLIHIHNVGDASISQALCQIRPTLQSVFNHIFYCPGGIKYLPFLGRDCRRPFGPGCLASAFTTHCNSVRPRALLSSYLRSKRMLRDTGADYLPFLTFSRYQADRLIESGVAPDRIHVLHPCTELPDLPPEAASPSTESTILFMGRIYPTKGLLPLLQALRNVAAPFRLIVVGDGPDLKAAKTLARKLGLSAQVEFAGWVPPEKHLCYYRQCSLVAVPALWPEPFGVVGIEAMAYGKPVVAFRTGGIPEWLEDGKTGFLIPPGDLMGLAGKIDFLLRNPALARQMGRKGRQRVEQQFTSRQYVPKLLEIYRQVIESWNPPSMKPS